jgi:tetratricopeptide (TPR) repeat protein
MGYCGLCSPRVVHIADLSILEVLVCETPLKKRSTGYFFPIVALYAAGTAWCFDGSLPLRELTNNDVIAGSPTEFRGEAQRLSRGMSGNGTRKTQYIIKASKVLPPVFTSVPTRPKWILAAFLFSAAAYGQNSEAAFRRALALHQSGDLRGAIDAYDECLRLDPNRYDARSNAGAVLAGLGRYREAIEQYRQALITAPPQFGPRLRQNLALAFYKSGQYADVIAILKEHRQSTGSDLQANLLLADSYLQNGEPAQAAHILGPYETSNSDDKGVAYVLGTALIRSGQISHGQKVIDRILRDGDSAESRFLVGVTMFVAADYPGAVKQLSGALALNAELPSLHSFYGQALLATGDPDGAAKAFREELTRNPNDFDSNLRLGEIYKQRRGFSEAQPLLERAAMQRPHSLEAQADLAGLELDRHNYTRAAQLFETVTRQWPESPGPHAQLAEAYEALGREPEASKQRQIAAKLLASIKPTDDAGPKPGEFAPGFSLPRLGNGSALSLAQFRSGKPAVLLFGSYTCPNFRGQANAVNALADKYHSAVPFLLVYIREAHTGDTWQSTINQRQGIDWQPARTMGEMQAHASSCVRRLKMNFPAVVDSIDGKAESKYSAWPSRLYVVGKDGRILYRTRLSELDFHTAEVEAAIRSATLP